MPIVKYYKGEEKTVVIEKKDYSKSIFSEQYALALKLFNRIQARPMDDVPNMIAFCGDRGEGKTSCMSTVCHIIDNLQDKSTLNYVSSLGIDGEALSKRRFEMLPIIDPAFFDKNHNVLELLLGHLYGNFKSFKSEENDYQTRKEVIGCFQRAKADLRHIDLEKGREEMYDPLEELEVLSAGVNLHATIKSLFEAYLKYVRKDLLVISIDDLDLNMTEAYRMSEQVRKYLNNDKCIILVSVKVEQLIEAIQNAIHLDANYPESLDTSVMASKYVTKLMPTATRIEMPRVYDLCNWELKIYEDRESPEPIEESRSVKEGIVRLIFNTTRYLFYNSKGGVSPIVPNNLRSMFHLLGLLSSMEIYEGDKDILKNNMHLFKSYFFKVWPRQLSERSLSVVNEILAREDSADLNKYVISQLKDRIDGDVPDYIETISSPLNYRYNVSVGDVLMLVMYLEQITYDEDLQHLLFFIKSFYSMLLFEKYDIITEQPNMLFPERITGGEIYKSDAWFNTTNVLQQFVAGAYFSYPSKEILAPEGKGGRAQFRDYKLINGDALSLLFKDIKEGMSNFEMMSKEASDSFVKKFKMAEFFALTVQSAIYSRDAKTFKTVDREGIAPYYLTPFSQNAGVYVFDITAPFFNIINVKYTYGRFKELADIYDFALSHPWSLLRGMISAAEDKDREEGYEASGNLDDAIKRLLSNAVLRNSEVISAVMEGMRLRRYSIRSSKINTEMLSEFYSGTVNSNMETYRRHEGEPPYFIRFVFLNPIIAFLKEVSPKEFDDIYNYQPVIEDDGEITKEMVMDMCPGFFYKFGAAKGLTLVKNMQERQPDVYSLLSEDDWAEVFIAEKKYRKEEAVAALRKVYWSIVKARADVNYDAPGEDPALAAPDVQLEANVNGAEKMPGPGHGIGLDEASAVALSLPTTQGELLEES